MDSVIQEVTSKMIIFDFYYSEFYYKFSFVESRQLGSTDKSLSEMDFDNMQGDIVHPHLEEKMDLRANIAQTMRLIVSQEVAISSHVQQCELIYYVDEEFFPRLENLAEQTVALPIGEYTNPHTSRTVQVFLVNDKFYERRVGNTWPDPVHAQRVRLAKMSRAKLVWINHQLSSIIVPTID